MIDETTGPGEQGAPEGRSEAGERVAFCQQCGKPLTSTTVRRVGAAAYCEPCLVARLEEAGPATGATAGTTGTGWTPVGGAVPPVGAAAGPAGVPPGSMPSPNAPSPWLAAFLGVIPGVGAMYNGQYAKGVAHLVIFAVLDTLQKNVNDIFGLLVLGWIIYQVLDAYHTAKARRDGTPLPNSFGLNDIGDRMGFGRNWPGSAARPVTSSTTAGWAAAAPVSSAANATASAGAAAGPNWAGYVPPTNFGATAPPPVQPTGYAASGTGAAGYGTAGYGTAGSTTSATAASTPWTETPYGGNPYAAPYGAGYPGAPVAPIPPVPAVRRFPVGAAWLIALGLIFLLANLNAEWRLSGEWIVTIVLAVLGSWMLFRRVEIVRAWARASGEEASEMGITPRLICQLRAPIMLLVLALLFALQADGVRTLGQTWGVLLIAFGALLILERMVGRATWYPVGTGVNPGVTPDRGAAATGKDGR